MKDTPLSKEHELAAQMFMDSVWDSTAQASQNLSAHEILGILETIQQKIGFDHNVRQAKAELSARRQPPTKDAGPSPIINKHGFPME